MHADHREQRVRPELFAERVARMTLAWPRKLRAQLARRVPIAYPACVFTITSMTHKESEVLLAATSSHIDIDTGTETETEAQDPTVLERAGIWSLDVRNWHLTWSKQARAIHGLQNSPAVSPWEALQLVDRAHGPELVSRFFRCVEEGVPFEFEFGFTTATRRRCRARLTGFALRDRQGQVMRVRGIIQECPATRVE